MFSWVVSVSFLCLIASEEEGWGSLAVSRGGASLLPVWGLRWTRQKIAGAAQVRHGPEL